LEVLHVSYSNHGGGAARAAFRILQAQRRVGLEATMLVNESQNPGGIIRLPKKNRVRSTRRLLSKIADAAIARLQSNSNTNLHSPAFFSAMKIKEINSTSADIVNLHWTGGGMLSVFAISRIKKPVVWTLHDMWAFSGSEHYDDGNQRWINGYKSNSFLKEHKGLDVDRLVWKFKKLLWKKPFSIVTPSNWLEESVKTSELMGGWPVETIPNPIDLEAWRAEDKQTSRNLLGLPKDGNVILFGAIGGAKDSRKGFDLLMDALNKLHGSDPLFSLVVFGQETSTLISGLKSKIIFLGSIQDDLTLRLAYSAADVFVIPSRQDNLPNTGIEATACGTPVVAFDIGGMSDIVQHRNTGYLARAFDAEDLAMGIEWALGQKKFGLISGRCRARAEDFFNYDLIGQKYQKLYERLIETASNN